MHVRLSIWQLELTLNRLFACIYKRTELMLYKFGGHIPESHVPIILSILLVVTSDMEPITKTSLI